MVNPGVKGSNTLRKECGGDRKKRRWRREAFTKKERLAEVGQGTLKYKNKVDNLAIEVGVSSVQLARMNDPRSRGAGRKKIGDVVVWDRS